VLSCPRAHPQCEAATAVCSRQQDSTVNSYPWYLLRQQNTSSKNLPVKSFPSPPQRAEFWQVAESGFLVSSTGMSPQQLLYHSVSHIMPYSTRSGSQPKMGEKSLT